MRDDAAATTRRGPIDDFADGWLDDDGHPDRRRARIVTAAAIAPWVVVALLMVLRGGGSGTPHDHVHLEDTAPDTTTATGAVEDGDVADEPAAPPEPPSGLSVVELRGDWRATPGAGGVGAIATAVARAWLSDVAPRLTAGPEGHGGDGLYAEHLVVEAVEQLDAQIAVATLLAVVLHDSDPLTVDVRRLAVPLHVGDDQARPAGAPWWLPEPDLDAVPLEWHPSAEQSDLLAAAEAIEAAGYREVSLESLEQSTSWPWRANVSARTPAGAAVTTPVLLRRHLDGFVVAGTVLGAGDGQGDRP